MRTAAHLLLFLALAGCPKRPLDFGKDGEPRDVAELLLRVRMAELAVSSLKGEAKLKAASDRGSGTAGLFVAVREPALVHLEALDFFGRPQAQLVTDGKTFGLYDAQAGRWFHGPSSQANLRRVLPVALPPEHLAALLLGRVPRRDEAAATMTLDRERGRFVVQLEGQTVEVEPPSYRVVKSSVPGFYDVELDGIEAYGHLTFPRHAVLVSGSTSMDLTWKSELELNGALEADMFEIAAPEGVPQVEVDERGNPLR